MCIFVRSSTAIRNIQRPSPRPRLAPSSSFVSLSSLAPTTVGVHYTSYTVEDQEKEIDVIPPQEVLTNEPPHTLTSFSTPPANQPGGESGRKRALTARRNSTQNSYSSPDKPQPQLSGQSSNQFEELPASAGPHQMPLSILSDALDKPPVDQLSPYARPYEVSRVVGPDCYYMGIIDFQQRWTLSKRLERHTKILFKGADADGLSAMPPEQYMQVR